MYHLKNVYKSFTFALFASAIVLFLNSCKGEVEHRFYYDDNVSLITDTSQIKYLELELASLVDTNLLDQSLRIKTSLMKKLNKTVDDITSKYMESTLVFLRSSDDYDSLKDEAKLKKLKFFCNVYVFENETGKVLYDEGIGDENYLKFSEINIIATNLIGYLILLENGANPLDSFQFIDSYSIGDFTSNGYKATLANGFEARDRSSRKLPYCDLKTSEWKKMNEKLSINHRLVRHDNGMNKNAPLMFSSMLDYLKTIAMIQAKGEIIEPSPISEIKNSNNESLYRRSATNNRPFNAQTLQKAKDLLKNGLKTSHGSQFYCPETNIKEDCYGLSFKYALDRNRSIYSSEKYTIMIDAYCREKNQEFSSIGLSWQGNRYFQYILKELGTNKEEGELHKYHDGLRRLRKIEIKSYSTSSEKSVFHYLHL